VIQRSQNARFTRKPCAPRGVVSYVWRKKLQCHFPPELRIACSPDDTHAAPADLFGQFVVSDKSVSHTKKYLIIFASRAFKCADRFCPV
jgi:hypothetical protein